MQSQQFGGKWTQEKLSLIKEYLAAYGTALQSQYFTRIYVDAFAGTGAIRKASSSSGGQQENLLLPTDEDTEDFFKGSPMVALEAYPWFHQYIFVERSKKNFNLLAQMKERHAGIEPEQAWRIQVVKSDANAFLTEWCASTSWTSTRAVVFLDPFGMQVEWEVLKTIAETQAIDLWLLVPLGIGVNRMMPQRKLPEEKWAARLTAFFGSEEWKSKFYAPVQRNPTLFDDLDETVSAGIEKNVSHDQLAAYFIDRLKEIFAGVAKNPIVQRNSVNSPMFLLCFAAGNPRGAPIAVRIAEHLLRKWNGN